MHCVAAWWLLTVQVQQQENHAKVMLTRNLKMNNCNSIGFLCDSNYRRVSYFMFEDSEKCLQWVRGLQLAILCLMTVRNVCNGSVGCSHLCLQTDTAASALSRCSCPSYGGLTLSSNGKTCARKWCSTSCRSVHVMAIVIYFGHNIYINLKIPDSFPTL